VTRRRDLHPRPLRPLRPLRPTRHCPVHGRLRSLGSLHDIYPQRNHSRVWLKSLSLCLSTDQSIAESLALSALDYGCDFVCILSMTCVVGSLLRRCYRA
jgi:hypothetical protein